MTKTIEQVFNHTEYEVQEERNPGNWLRFDYDWLGWRAVDKCHNGHKLNAAVGKCVPTRVLRRGKVWYYLDANGSRDYSKENDNG